MGDATENRAFAKLSSRAAAGDRDAFRQLVERSHRTVFRLAFRILQDPDGAEDVVQETYIRAWQGLADLRDHGAAYGWLCRVARNVAYDRFRAGGRRKLVRLDQPTGEGKTALVEQLADPQAGPERRLGSEQLGEAVRAAMDGLKEKHRLVLAFRELDGMSYEEIALALGCSIGTVESRLHRARKALAGKLKGLALELGKED